MHISIPSHLTFPTTTNLLLQDGRRLASIRGAQWGLDVPEWKRVLCGAYCSRITVRAHTRIRVLCRRTQYNEHSRLRMLCKNSNCHMWCCLFQWDPLGIGFDDHDKCGAELQMLMKYMSGFLCSQVCIRIPHFNWAKHTTLHLSHSTFTLTMNTYSKKEKKILRRWAALGVKRHADWSRLRNEPSSQRLTDRLFGSQRAVYLAAWKKKKKRKKIITEVLWPIPPSSPWVGDRGTDLCLHDAALWFTRLGPPHSPLAG